MLRLVVNSSEKIWWNILVPEALDNAGIRRSFPENTRGFIIWINSRNRAKF